ncbi:hypothetical protein TVAG_379240 [Trichomonas vaginalis G3]|uniref:Uncharacterized protein n=1 Tax=Trichomonas vaginalis (strain ATCC PRA-98 / G3) TaxID=412133 RepID=A2DBB5_TRIV3|nr:hypothetical protein TVAGG3_0508470 [Trichomonas vaginalis G3]EAY22445.1 hypothetical protein TVAG_379240 [Trichomonas vaginalis G3]KAI5517606.1 hypothetical protein TVAGG3_0508470 [Trichomonas vaginalis G3]|eukprot:XP_001583431.1 hypothetical protein [Trichomonas vaginalis G3]
MRGKMLRIIWDFENSSAEIYECNEKGLLVLEKKPPRKRHEMERDRNRFGFYSSSSSPLTGYPISENKKFPIPIISSIKDNKTFKDENKTSKDERQADLFTCNLESLKLKVEGETWSCTNEQLNESLFTDDDYCFTDIQQCF